LRSNPLEEGESDIGLSTIESYGANNAKKYQGNQAMTNPIEALFSVTSSQKSTILGDTFRDVPMLSFRGSYFIGLLNMFNFGRT